MVAARSLALAGAALQTSVRPVDQANASLIFDALGMPAPAEARKWRLPTLLSGAFVMLELFGTILLYPDFLHQVSRLEFTLLLH